MKPRLISTRIKTQVFTRLSRCAARKSVPLTRAAVTASCGSGASADAGALAWSQGPVMAGSALQADLGRHLNRGALGIGDAPELGVLEAELAGDEVAGEALHCGVQGGCRVVVVLAREADLVLGRGELFHELLHRLVSLQVRVAF